MAGTVLCGLSMAWASPEVSRAEGAASLEYPVKAAFLLNFAKFTEWPPDSPQAVAESVSICVFGDDPFGLALDKTVEGRLVGGRPIVLRRYRSLADVEPCHVLFIAKPESERLPLVFARLGGQPVITVGESEGFTRRGGVIELSVENNRARFEINLRVAERLGLGLSSRLLAVARNFATSTGGH